MKYRSLGYTFNFGKGKAKNHAEKKTKNLATSKEPNVLKGAQV
jgi:hypothetical protein